jgi:hypothetical protein
MKMAPCPVNGKLDSLIASQQDSSKRSACMYCSIIDDC